MKKVIITIALTDIKKIIKKYYEELYDHKFDNLYEIDQFFEWHTLPNLTQKEIEYVDKSIARRVHRWIPLNI